MSYILKLIGYPLIFLGVIGIPFTAGLSIVVLVIPGSLMVQLGRRAHRGAVMERAAEKAARRIARSQR